MFKWALEHAVETLGEIKALQTLHEHGPYTRAAVLKDIDLLSCANMFVGTTGSSFSTSIRELIAARATFDGSERPPRFASCQSGEKRCEVEDGGEGGEGGGDSATPPTSQNGSWFVRQPGPSLVKLCHRSQNHCCNSELGPNRDHQRIGSP